MQDIVIAALMGVLFLPGSASAPVAMAQTIATTSADDEPSPISAAALAAASGKPVPATDPKKVDSYVVHLTAYNAVPEQTDGDPTTTASGADSNAEVIAARSQDLAKQLPFGTVIAVYGPDTDSSRCHFNSVKHLIGYRVIADTMAVRWTKRVDIQFDQTDTVKVDGVTMNPARALGVCSGITVKVVGRVPVSHIPTTQAGLAKLFDGTTELALNLK